MDKADEADFGDLVHLVHVHLKAAASGYIKYILNEKHK